MSEYDEDKPLRELQAMKQTLAAMQDVFCDASGLPLDIGTPVRYNRQREEWEWSETSPWTPERWGVVTGFSRTTSDFGKKVERQVQVTSVYVRDDESGAWHNDQWSAKPEHLWVIQ